MNKRADELLQHRQFALLLCIGTFIAYLSSANFSRLRNIDTLAAAIPAWALGMHHTTALHGFLAWDPWIQEENGAPRSNRLPGIIFWGALFYRLLGSPTSITFFPAAVAAAVATALATALMFITLRRLTGARVALGGAFLFAFGTGTWTVSADALWTHTGDQLWLSVAMLATACGLTARSGLALAAAIFTRPHTALFAAATGLWKSWIERSVRPSLTMGLASSIGIVALVLYNWRTFGSPTVLGHYSGHVGDAEHVITSGSAALEFSANLLGTFASPLRGMLTLSPFLLLLLPGLPAGWRTAPWWVRSYTVGGIAYLIIQCASNNFAGGSNFYSYRLPLETLTAAWPLVALAYVAWTRRAAWRRRLFAVLAMLSVGIHSLGAFGWQDGTDSATKAWTRYEPWLALQHASPLKLAIVGACMILAAALLRWLEFHPHPESPDAADLIRGQGIAAAR